MNTAIYNNRGIKIAGSVALPKELPDAILFEDMPCYKDGVLYCEQDENTISAIRMDEGMAKLAINKEQVILQPTEEKLFRAVLFGNLDLRDITALCKRLRIRFDEKRTVFSVMPNTDVNADMLGALKSAFESEDVKIIDVSAEEIAVVFSGVMDSDLLEVANAVRDTFANEFNTDVHIGIGEPVGNLIGICNSREEAQLAIAIGRRLSYSGGAWQYNRLLPEMLLAGVTEETLNQHAALILRIQHTVDEDTQGLLDELFRQNLNISQTAKELYMHRNTLIYRLDKIRKNTGLDATRFDDAVTLRIILALARLNYKD